MDVDELISVHPRLYHMTDSSSWPGIQAHGLLSTTALLDLFEIKGPQRMLIESERRPESITLTHPDHGIAVVRDNKPLSESKLKTCLIDGLGPADWYRILNGFVFFWLSIERLQRLLRAKAYREQANLVLEIDTAALVHTHGASVRLSAINTGATAHRPVPRGATTFTTIGNYPFEELRKRRTRATAIAELAVRHSVPDVMSSLLAARIYSPNGDCVTIT